MEIRQVRNIAHRGASAYAPENTVEAFEEAIVRNADMIEFDLRRTSDGVIVVYHDSHIDLADGSKQAVSRMTYSELAEYTGKAGFKLATFERVLSDFGPRIAMNIEVKIGGFERELIKMLKCSSPEFRPVISSFKPQIIRQVKRIDPSALTGLVVGSRVSGAVRFLTKPLVRNLFSGTQYDSIHLHKELASSEIIDGLLDSGFSVYVWTVNEPDLISTLISFGVTGIISDVPDVVHGICHGKTVKVRASRSVKEHS